MCLPRRVHIAFSLHREFFFLFLILFFSLLFVSTPVEVSLAQSRFSRARFTISTAVRRAVAMFARVPPIKLIESYVCDTSFTRCITETSRFLTRGV